MKNIYRAILAVCIVAFGCLAAQAQGTESNTWLGLNAGTNAQEGNLTLYDTGIGFAALASDRDGYNTAVGFDALLDDSTGYQNAATGYEALYSNTTGYDNTAVGYEALYSNTTGAGNEAIGNGALQEETTGGNNVADGSYALQELVTGQGNTAIGGGALGATRSGNYNIAIGLEAGYEFSSGASGNIDIGNEGNEFDSGVIRIGGPGNGFPTGGTAFYAAGIDGVTISSGIPVYINSSGQLGTVNSSIRFKEDVHDMAAASDGLMRLRPVTYRYKQPYADGSKPIDYGLIAEEVAQVYPDLVVKSADGQIQTVQYQKLTPMLLNEVQKQHLLLQEQETKIEQLEKQLAALPLLEKRLAALEAIQPSTAKLEARLATE